MKTSVNFALLVSCLLVIGFAHGSYVSTFDVEVVSCSWFADPRLCAQYDMEFVKMKSCWFGRKSIICRKKTTANNIVNEDENSLHMVAYNVRQIPPLFTRECERERTCRIPEAIFKRLPSVDVISFEELFYKGCVEGRADVARLLKAYNFTWSYQPLDHPHLSAVGAGVMIASRWPMVKKAGHAFGEKEIFSSDFLASKGVVYAAIQKKNKRYHIFATHTQSGYGKAITNIRHKQAKEIYAFKTKMNIPSNEAVIFAGDFNEDYYAANASVQIIFSSLNATIAKKIGSLKYTFANINDLVPDTDKNEWLDYIATSNSNLKPKKATMEAVDLRADKKFPYCRKSPLILQFVAPYSRMCSLVATTDYLSDHYLLYGKLQF